MICVQPMSPRSVAAASARIAVAPFGWGAVAARPRHAMPSSPQHLDEMDARGGELRIGEVDARRREQRSAQRSAVVDVGQRLAGAHGDARAHATERRARARHHPPFASPARRSSAAVRMSASQGSPAWSFSRIAPTAPKVPATLRAGVGAKACSMRPDDALRRPAGEDVQARRRSRCARPSLVGLRSGDLHDALPLDDVVVEVAAELVGRHHQRRRALPRPLVRGRRAGSGSS